MGKEYSISDLLDVLDVERPGEALGGPITPVEMADVESGPARRYGLVLKRFFSYPARDRAGTTDRFKLLYIEDRIGHVNLLAGMLGRIFSLDIPLNLPPFDFYWLNPECDVKDNYTLVSRVADIVDDLLPESILLDLSWFVKHDDELDNFIRKNASNPREAPHRKDLVDGLLLLYQFQERRKKGGYTPPVIVYSYRGGSPFPLYMSYYFGASAVFYKGFFQEQERSISSWMALDLLNTMLGSMARIYDRAPGVRFLGSPRIYRFPPEIRAVETPQSKSCFLYMVRSFEDGRVVILVGPEGSGRRTLMTLAAKEAFLSSDAPGNPETFHVEAVDLFSTDKDSLARRFDALLKINSPFLILFDAHRAISIEMIRFLQVHLRELKRENAFIGVFLERSDGARESERIETVEALFEKQAGYKTEFIPLPSLKDRFGIGGRPPAINDREFWPLFVQMVYEACRSGVERGSAPTVFSFLSRLSRYKDQFLDKAARHPFRWEGELNELRYIARVFAARWDGQRDTIGEIFDFAVDTFEPPPLERRDPKKALGAIGFQLLNEYRMNLQDLLLNLVEDVKRYFKLVYPEEDDFSKVSRMQKEWMDGLEVFIQPGVEKDRLYEGLLYLAKRLLRKGNSLEEIEKELEYRLALWAFIQTGSIKNRTYEFLKLKQAPGRRILDEMFLRTISECGGDMKRAAEKLGISVERLEEWHQKQGINKNYED